MTKKAVLGCELNNQFLQVSYAPEGEMPITLKNPATGGLLQIPLVIGRHKDSGQWMYGEDAQKKLREWDGNVTDRLLEHFGESIRLYGELYTYEELLHLFLSHALKLAMYCIEALEKEPAELLGMTISVEPFTAEMLPYLKKSTAGLQIPQGQIHLQGHEESLFSYMIHQPEKLLGFSTGVFDLTDEHMVTYRMEMNQRTTPVVTSIQKDEDTGIVKRKHYSSIIEHDKQLEQMDEMLAEYVQRFTEGRIVTSIYLIGDGFAKDWYQKSRRLLCRGRKVYAGNNLFSKGAAFSAASRIWPGTEKEDFLFLGREMLRMNVGMKVIDEGKEVYLPLLDAGQSWYEAKSETEILLESADEITLLITPIFTGKTYEETIRLDEEETRPGRAFRFRMLLEMKSADTLRIRLRDEGFGSFYAPVYAQKEFTIQLTEAQ
ncbi:MAG: hypothetical protein K6E18_10060 [Lachnospiraceae bacterium]|nr:hypothetical protein [Lachnospiraceae bacterium]